MVDYQTIAELVSQIPADTWNLLQEIKQRRPAMMLSELIDYSKRVSRPSSPRNYNRRSTRLLIQGRNLQAFGLVHRPTRCTQYRFTPIGGPDLVLGDAARQSASVAPPSNLGTYNGLCALRASCSITSEQVRTHRGDTR